MDNTLSNSIMSILTATTAITSKLDTFVIGSTTYYAIFKGRMIPAMYQELNRTLQIYRVSIISPHDINEVLYSISCRSTSESASEDLAKAVYEATNRVMTEHDGLPVYFRTSVLQAIMETENLWNTPVEIRVTNRS